MFFLGFDKGLVRVWSDVAKPHRVTAVMVLLGLVGFT